MIYISYARIIHGHIVYKRYMCSHVSKIASERVSKRTSATKYFEFAGTGKRFYKLFRKTMGNSI